MEWGEVGMGQSLQVLSPPSCNWCFQDRPLPSTIVRVPVHSQHLILRNWCLQDWQCMTSQLFTVSISNVINVTFVINSNNPPYIGNIIAAFKSYFQIVIVIANHIDRHQLREVGPPVGGLMEFMGLWTKTTKEIFRTNNSFKVFFSALSIFLND